METKIGVYICKGCDIGESLDIDKLVEVANDEMKAARLQRRTTSFCSQEGIGHRSRRISRTRASIGSW